MSQNEPAMPAGAATPGQPDSASPPPAETSDTAGDGPPGTTPDGGWTPTDVTPPTGWTAAAAARPAGRFRLLPRLIIPGIIVAVLIVGFLFRDRVSGNAVDLKPGDCFDDSAGSSGGVVKDVQHRPCSEPHLYETIETFKFPTSGDAAFPGQTALEAFVVEKCSPALVGYIGIAEEQSSLTYSAYLPVEIGWKEGGRDIVCILGALDGSKLTGSMKNARR